MKTLETSKTLLVTNRSRMEDSKIKTLINSPLLSGPWCRTWSHNKCIQMQVHVVTAKTNIKTTTNRTNKIKDIRIALTARTHTPTMVRDVVDTSKDKDKATTATKTCKCKSKIQFNPDHNQCHNPEPSVQERKAGCGHWDFVSSAPRAEIWNFNSLHQSSQVSNLAQHARTWNLASLSSFSTSLWGRDTNISGP